MFLLLINLVGCDQGGTVKTDGNGDTGTPWWVQDTDPDAPPRIGSGSVRCQAGSNSSGDLFFVAVDVIDPNGNETLSSLESRIIMEDGGGNEVFDEAILVCDGSTTCECSWRSGDYGGVACGQGPDYSYFAVVVDQDGNDSDTFQLSWLD